MNFSGFNRLATEISSSISSQWIPIPPPINPHSLLCFSVALKSRGNHTSGTDTVRPSSSTTEGITVFGDPLSLNTPDPDHSGSEQRYIVMGMSDRYRLLVVCYTEIHENTRIISARQATRAERKSYEEK